MGSWELDESSGFLSNFRGTVKDSYAGTDPRYNDGNTTLVIWEVEVAEVLQDFEGDVPEELTINFPLPPGWESEDGTTVEHEKGKEKFHASSIYGKLIGAITGNVDGYGRNVERTDGEDLELGFDGLADVLAERGFPQDTEIWKGLTFEFAEVRFDYGINRKTKEAMVSNRTMPVSFVTEEGGSAKKASKPAAKKAGAAKKAAPKAAESTEDKVAAARAKAEAAKKAAAGSGDSNPFAELVDDVDLAATLNQILDSSADYNAFVEAVLEVPEVVSDDELIAKLLDDDTGPWSTKS